MSRLDDDRPIGTKTDRGVRLQISIASKRSLHQLPIAFTKCGVLRQTMESGSDRRRSHAVHGESSIVTGLDNLLQALEDVQ